MKVSRCIYIYKDYVQCFKCLKKSNLKIFESEYWYIAVDRQYVLKNCKKCLDIQVHYRQIDNMGPRNEKKKKRG